MAHILKVKYYDFMMRIDDTEDVDFNNFNNWAEFEKYLKESVKYTRIALIVVKGGRRAWDTIYARQGNKWIQVHN